MPGQQIDRSSKIAPASFLHYSMASGRFVVLFQLGGQICGLPVEQVQEIVPMALLAHPPGLPSILEGFLNLRGTAVPVLRLNRLFDLPATHPELYTPLIILRGLAHPLALLADKVTGTISVPPESLLPISENHSFNNCAECQIAVDNQVILLLHSERLLLEKERQCVVELQSKAQQYLSELEAAQR